MVIIGLTGKKGCGKSTAALEISGFTDGENFTRLAFAEPLKDMVETLLFRFGVENMYTLDKNDIIIGVGVSLRYLYQTLGTEWGRNIIGQDLWIKAMDNQLTNDFKRGDRFVIDDVRFENEADYIRRKGGVIVHIERPGLISSDNHRSERGIAFKDGDIKVINSDKDEYLHQIRCLAENLTTINHPLSQANHA